MARPVKTRTYDDRGRRSASNQRRSRILAAARELFLQRGYAGTTMAAVAEQAQVALDTVYELVGRKPALFRLLVETAISGQDQAVPAEEREYVRQIQAEPTADGKLRIYAHALPAIQSQLAPLFAVLQQGASAEPQLAELRNEIAERRAANMHRLAGELDATGELAVPVDQGADVIWATNSSEIYLLLVHQRGWTPEDYGQWLADSWPRLFLHSRERARPGAT